MKTIGGYFEWEFPSAKNEHYSELGKVNSGRSAFAALLRIGKFNKVFMPHYICDSMHAVAKKEGIECELYKIDKNLNPVAVPKLNEGEVFFVVNYFGLKSNKILELDRAGMSLIVDNVQSFFQSPLGNTRSLYSPRKFFGVPDGGYYWAGEDKFLTLPRTNSSESCGHLLVRFESGPEAGYETYLKNEDWIRKQPLMEMSKISQGILSSIDYQGIRQRRDQNFEYLHRELGAFNELELGDASVPALAYPFVTSKPGLREKLIGEKIFVAQYWPEIFKRCSPESNEWFLADHLIPLPMDQRYNSGDLVRVVELVKDHLS